ncbi:MAG: hypothetical protein ACD_60C00100G0021 [uncultured bacterium]|nr:MAG: hypothetical protein ACD_60C00100G0021 [uncultured bacterium]
MFKKLGIASMVLAVGIGTLHAARNSIAYVGLGPGFQNTGGYNGLVGNVFAGYGEVLGKNKDFYLGGEIFANVGSIPVSNNQANRSLYGVGLSLIPGFIVYPGLVGYGRIGAAASRYHASNGLQGDAQVGLGVLVHLVRNWDVRTEYVRTLGPGFLDNFSKALTNQFNVGFVYRF